MDLKIATWNMAHREPKDRWDYLINEVSPDIALVQEARPPAEAHRSDENNSEYTFSGYKLIWEEIGGTRKWGSGVVTKNLPVDKIKSPEEFKNSYAGALTGAKVTLPDGKSLHVFSIYGLIAEDPYSIPMYYTPTLHRMLSDLESLLVHLNKKRQDIIVGGDLNSGIQFDEKFGTKRYYTHAHRILFDRMKDFGLEDCFPKFFKKPVQTLRHVASKEPWQNDYLLVSRHLIDNVKDCKVITEDAVLKLSDHNPVVIELHISD